MFTRRTFLKSGGLAAFSVAVGKSPLFRTGPNSGSGKTLVVVFLRGAMDGLMAVTPFNDPMLKKMRPRLAMTPANCSGPSALIDLDSRFALHPGLAPFAHLYKEGRLAIIHGVGSPDPTRSHLDAQEYMETGTPGLKRVSSGWLNRACGLLAHDPTPYRAVSTSPALPRSLYGNYPALTISDLKGTFGRSETFGNYHESPLGNSLKQIAHLIKADVGLEIAFAEMTGWDTHVQQGTIDGTFAQQARDFSDSIASFWEDIEPHQDDVVLLTMTEFGRTVHENGSGGTDHGRGSCMFVLGNAVDGGKVYGSIPVLDPDALEDRRGLPVTTDFRAVFSEVAEKHLEITREDTLLPGWTGKRFPFIKRSLRVA